MAFTRLVHRYDTNTTSEMLAAEARAYASAQPAVRIMTTWLGDERLQSVWPQDLLRGVLTSRPEAWELLLHELTGTFPEILRALSVQQREDLFEVSLKTPRREHFVKIVSAHAWLFTPYLRLDQLYSALLQSQPWDDLTPNRSIRDTIVRLLEDLTSCQRGEPIITQLELYQVISPWLRQHSEQLPVHVRAQIGTAYLAYQGDPSSEPSPVLTQTVAEILSPRALSDLPLMMFRPIFDHVGVRLFGEGWGASTSDDASTDADRASERIATVATQPPAAARGSLPPGPNGALSEVELRLGRTLVTIDSAQLTSELIRNLEAVVLRNIWLPESSMRQVIVHVLLTLCAAETPHALHAELSGMEYPALCRRFLDALQPFEQLLGMKRTLESKRPGSVPPPRR